MGSEYQRLSYEWSEADWASNTHIVEGDSMNAVRTRAAHEAYLAFVGSTENINAVRGYIAQRDQLAPLQVRQLERMLYDAAQGLLEETTGRSLDAQAMLDYFEPLYDWLVAQNQEREHTLD